jgi:hypothetical protein
VLLYDDVQDALDFDLSPFITMTDYIRRIVSGNKARFKDGKLNLELGTSCSLYDP